MEGRMQEMENLRTITNWINHGTLGQFEAELSARLRDDEQYHVQLMDGVLQVHRTHRKSGILGLGGEQKQELVLEVADQGSGLVVRELTADQELVDFLANSLKSQ